MASLDKLQLNPRLQRMPKNEQEWVHFANELAKFVADAVDFATAQSDISTAQSDISTAQTDITTNNVTSENKTFSWWTDYSTGNNPAGDPSKDLTVNFTRKGTTIATRTVRGSLETSSGNITLSNVSSTGDATTIVATGSGSSDANYVVTHTASGIIAKASWSLADISGSGGSPSK